MKNKMQSVLEQRRSRLVAQLESFLRETALHTGLEAHLPERVEEELVSAADLGAAGRHASALSVSAR